MTDGRDRVGEGDGGRERRPLTGAPRPLATLGTITSADRCTGRDRKERGDNDRWSSRWIKKKRKRKEERKKENVKDLHGKFLLDVTVKITTSGKQQGTNTCLLYLSRFSGICNSLECFSF